MLLAHRIALDPTNSQAEQLLRTCGVARFAWNWGLAEWTRQYHAGLKPNWMQLRKQWNASKHLLFPWVADSPKDANQEPFRVLGKAFNQFFRGIVRHPKFKQKGKNDSFYVSNHVIAHDGSNIRLPVIGWVRMRQELRFSGKVMSATVSRQADRWYVSVTIDVGESYSRPRTGDGSVGIDLGISAAVTTSGGAQLQAPKPLRRCLRKLRSLSKSVSRKKKGSNNRRKAVQRLARCHARISDVRKDWTHKATTRLCRENQAVAMEDLCVKGMLCQRAIRDVGLGEFRRQMEYKAPLHGTRLAFVDRYYPSTKTCSGCGAIKDVPLSERVYRCDACGLEVDRDLNAAYNIRTAGLAGTACGSEGLRVGLADATRRDEAGTTVKVESNVPLRP